MQPLDNARYTQPDTLGQLDVLRIRHPLMEATIALQGGHLVAFAPTGDTNWLWMSPQARFEEGVAIRGGIPICWPWFGDPARNPEAVRSLISSDSAHGFARSARWTLDHLEELEETVQVALTLSGVSAENGYPWRGRADARLTFSFSPDTVTLALTTRNTGPDPLPISQALHTYLPTDRIADTRILGLEGAGYLDTLEGWQACLQAGAVTFQGETDRIYKSAAPLLIQTPGRNYHLASEGSKSTVIWNPGPEKAARLSDFPDDGWTGMLCAETANAADDYRSISPGSSHTLYMSLTKV